MSVYELRQALGDDAIVVAGDDVTLNPEVLTSDVALFEDAIVRGDLEQATTVYTGPFLDGFHSAGAGEFNRWVESERARMAHAYASALMGLAGLRSKQGDHPGALEAQRRLVDHDPLNSPNVLRLMEALDAAGDRSGALRVAQLHATLLQQELGADEDPAVAALAERLRSRTTRTAKTLRGPPEPNAHSSDAARAAASALTEIGEACSAPARDLPLVNRAPASKKKWFLAIASLATAAAISLGGILLALHRSRISKLNPNALVVAPFVNRTGDSTLDLMGDMAADWITRGLLETGLVQIDDQRITFGEPRKAVARARRVPEQRSASYVPSDIQILAAESGAGIVVWGSYYRQRDSLRFEAQVTDTRRAKVLSAIDPVSGLAKEPRELVERLRQHVIADLATLLDPRLNTWANLARQPPTYTAYREFVEGLDEWNQVAGIWPSGALLHFYRAASFDSTYIMPLIWAARVHAWLNECEKADSIGRIVSTSHADLTAVESSLLDEALGFCRGDMVAVYETARRLKDAMPGSEFAAGRFGRYAVQINRAHDAVAVLERLDPARGALRGWPPYYTWLTTGLHALGEHDLELQAARRGRQQYPDNLAMLRVELFALAALGRISEVNQGLDEVAMFPPHPVRRPSAVMIETALELRAHGYPEAAHAVLQRVLDWCRSRPAQDQGTALYRFDLAHALLAAGMWDSSRVLAESLALQHAESLSYQGLLGVVAAHRGQRRESERIDSLLAAVPPLYQHGVPSYWRAAIAAQLGDRQKAVALLFEASEQGFVDEVRASRRMIGPFLHSDLYFESLRDYSPFRELLRPKD